MAIKIQYEGIVTSCDESSSWNEDSDGCTGYSVQLEQSDGKMEIVESHFDYSGMTKHTTRNRVWVSIQKGK